ncbi:hormogonium polysaccharide biosynthesis protein HpsA [Planktothrix agardhii 1801]|uniref:hormogonium polysaccharide biosynthesis protein HpsA n=1 Tax=Planktothrix agardhii TaxID=1160 RepID=UPI001F16DF1E|nr:hormogonium polysaccharide biosynthesis protein HpsA [Planktothrix agardhii]MCF3623323.1 hormogonium polysaccharide biosynthesis protein HpsA [Planktothrix agardhii 1801]
MFRSIRIAFQRMTRRTMRSLLRVWMRINRQDRYGRAGFVLPTVVMVMLVVVLLSVTIMFRSMDRAKMAQYNRVSEATLNAAAPALERAKAKLSEALKNAQTKGTTPDEESDANFATILETFKFGDEERLTVEFVDNKGSKKELKTAWRFPADTDGNGKEDSYILYEILYARPDDYRKDSRTALQARAVPMPSLPDETLPDECKTQVAANDRDDLSLNWSKRGENLQKSVFVYITAVPILNPNPTSTQEKKSNTSFPTLEYHLELIRKSLGNNAVFYDGDLEISPGPAFYLNGAIRTNSNLLVTPTGTNAFELKLLSSPNSCFSRDPKNSKITVAGNVVNGTLEGKTPTAVTVDLHQGATVPPSAAIDTTYQSSSDTAPQVAYNSDAYEQRIARLVEAWTTDKPTSSDDPPSLIQSLGRKRALELYFRDRTRKVPFKEVAEGIEAISSCPTPYQDTKETLRPCDLWAYSIQGSKSVTGLALKSAQMKAVKPSNEDKTEYFIGDRVQVGNGQPALQYDGANEKFNPGEQPFGNWVTKEDKPGEARLRPTQQIPEFNIAIDRDGFWEKVAAQLPKAEDEGRGGLRVITGAGVYKPGKLSIPNPLLALQTYNDPATTATEAFPLVWPDTMPGNGDLQMRATAVYHYADNGIVDSTKIPIGEQKPIACVSSYYDPTNKTTATTSTSNNGNVYNFPSRPSVSASKGATGLFTGSPTDLVEQANYVFPDGRFANKPLRDALDAIIGGKTVDKLSLAQQSAIDTTACALGILNNTATASTVIPNMAIHERTLLDARQIKAVTKNNKATTVDETFTLSSPLSGGQEANLGDQPKHDLPLEQRQPLEVRVTVLDLDKLRTTSYAEKSTDGPSGEYLLPLSGLIYASREDALPDLSYRKPSNGKIDEFTQNLVSRTDYKLDPTRSPDGIMLINGSKLFRGTNSESNPTIERGLILATNNPVYVKGDFNLHTEEEFTDARLGDADYWTKFYTRSTLSKVYGCRTINGKDCTGIDEWRPATILADAINILSDNFREGYRNEGDFDLRNNAGNGVIGYDFNGDGIKPTDSIKESDVKLDLNGDEDQSDTIPENEVTIKAARLLNGFYENNFVTNGLSSGAFGFTSGQINFPLTGTALKDADYIISPDTTTNPNSSYFNNLVTPIQRRETFSEYVMEICKKPTVSACEAKDWVVKNASNTDVKASSLIGSPETDLSSGTTATLPTAYQGFPRRVAFLRGDDNKLILDGSQPVPLGINPSGSIACYSSATSDLGGKTCTVFSTSDGTSGATKRPRTKANALWFQTRNSTNRSWDSQYPLWYFFIDPTKTGINATTTAATYTTATVQQPLLVPVLQIYTTNKPAPQTSEPTAVTPGKAIEPPTTPGGIQATSTRWLPRAKDTTYNMVMAVGDVPGRPGETNGGLQNLARLLENWRGPGGTNDIKKTMILGSFMQLFRSAYATAPYFPVRNPAENVSFFGYTPTLYNSSGGGRVPFQSASDRQWGYDVALLKQVPDLFSTLFTIPQDSNVIAGNEYFREVGRDDEWVKQFVCNAKIDGNYAATNTSTKPSGC